MSQQKIESLLTAVFAAKTCKKIILSKPMDKTKIRATAVLLTMQNVLFVQVETFLTDGKALHQNIPENSAPQYLATLFLQEYFQMNVITSSGECEIKRSKNGKVLFNDKIKWEHAPILAPQNHNQTKNYILQENVSYEFLELLGISNSDGRVFDRKRAKFRQINRFLEIIADIYEKLPAEGNLFLCDLCCGKSYLTFAVYYYFTVIRKRTIFLQGIDRKPDVIAFCTELAQKLNFDGLHFLCADINAYQPQQKPHLVISLHACDIATDIVLANAVRWDTAVILSTPCCHHEMFEQIANPQLSFLLEHSMLKQKLCEAATDALRAKRLEIEGYHVTTLELIDPEETPKNLMIRAVKLPNQTLSSRKKAELQAQYQNACAFLQVKPFLQELLYENN